MPKCFHCKANFQKKPELLDHLEEKHGDLIPDDMSVSKYYYAQLHGGNTEGHCQICKATTEFDEKTGKPFIMCKSEKCKQISRERFKENMKKTYGVEHLGDDVEHQKKMLASREKHGKYKFADGGEVGYMCSLELEFLRYCDLVMEFKSQEVEEMKVVLKYTDEKGRERNYILDYYLNMYNCIVEIKEGGDNPNTHPNYIENTKNKEKFKDMALLKQKDYNVIKIYNNDFRPLFKILFNIKNDMLKNKKPTKQFIEMEDKIANTFYSESADDFFSNIEYRDLYLVEFREKYTQSIMTVGITDTASLHYIYLPIEDVGFVPTSADIAALKNTDVSLYQYTGDKSNLDYVLNLFKGELIEFKSDIPYELELLKVLYDSNIMVNLDPFFFNNEDGLNDFELVHHEEGFKGLDSWPFMDIMKNKQTRK